MTRFQDRLLDPAPGMLGELIRFPLSAFSLPYLGLVRLRILAYRRGWLKSLHLNLPVISIGNLTLGGTGKTPIAIWLAEKLASNGIRPAVSIRGYRSRSENKLTVLTGESGTADPGLVGDEAALIAQRLKSIPVLVGKDRGRSGAKARELGAQVLILDDGFQHLKLGRNLDLVLVDGRNSPAKERMFPRGKLREPVSSLRRADLIIITRAQDSIERLERELKSFQPDSSVFKMRYRVIEDDKISGKNVFAFAGIADPEQFFELAQSLPVTLAGKKAFSDHHYYQDFELKGLAEEAKKNNAELLLTTEKDLVRIRNFKTEIPIRALKVEPDFFGDEDKIMRLVINKLKEWKNAESA